MNRKYDGYVGILMPTGLAKIRSTDFTSPLGQNLLVAYLVDRIPRFSAVAVDGERTSEAKIEKMIERTGRNPLVGFTLLSGNSSSTFALAQRLAENGREVIIGGPEITSYGPASIMQSRPFVKYGVMGAGERTLLQIADGADLRSIPNLTFRDSEGLYVNPYNKTIAENIDWAGVRVDYELLVDLEKGKGVTYLTGNDCFIAHNRCVFCGRLPMGNPSTEVESRTRIQNAWKELEQAQKHGIKKFYNSADSVGVDKEHLKKFAATKPQDFEIDFHHMFFNAHEVVPEIIPPLQKLNATVYLGIENIALKPAAEKAGLQFYRHDLPALALLRDAGIPARISFVLGLPGESDKTMQENLEGIVRLVGDYPNVTDLELNPAEILPGTKLFERLMATEGAEQFRKTLPPYDTLKMSEVYALEFCDIPRKRTIEWIKKIYENVRKIRPKIMVNTKGISQAEYDLIKSEEESKIK
jgi:radical SAM superfamily enzyme YgiQ (UPF0313 family)